MTHLLDKIFQNINVCLLYIYIYIYIRVATRFRICFLEIVDRNLTEDHIVKFLTERHQSVLFLYAKYETTYNGNKRKILDTQDKERQMFDCKKQECLVKESYLT